MESVVSAGINAFALGCIEVPLTKGKCALVDNEDAWVLDYNWSVNHDKRRDVFYAQRGRLVGESYKPRTIIMHRVIMERVLGTTIKFEIDHINHDGLDNRRSNLRVATHSENQANTKRVWGKSKYRGVYWCKGNNKWRATIEKNNRKLHVGYFVDEIEAAKAYDKVAFKLNGAFAYQNFPSQLNYEMRGKNIKAAIA